METRRGEIAKASQQLERKITISEREIGAYKFSLDKHGNVYDLLLPDSQKSLASSSLFPIKILLARR
jgi:hypothetical protein